MSKKKALSQSSYRVSEGVLNASPIVLAYLPVAFALGVLSGQLQYSAGQTLFQFASAFSGSGQSVALQALRLGQPVLAIWSTILIINLRYALMASVLAPEISAWPARVRYLFAFFITDETFALHSGQFKTFLPPISYVFAVNVTAWAAWILGGVLGLIAGAYVPDVTRFGFDFAVPGMFIALVVLQIEDRLMLLLGILGGILGLLLTLTPFKSWSVIVSGIFCATLGTWVDRWKLR